MFVSIGTPSMWLYTTSACTAIVRVRPCETPPVTAIALEFCRSLSTMLMFCAAVDANDSGSRPPNGSGYEGLLMVMFA